MAVSKEKKEALSSRMEELGINEHDLIEKFILGSGKGGQKVNKTASCVYLKHTPTRLEVKCQKDRSRDLNRFLARRELCDKIASSLKDKKTKKLREQHKIKRQKKRRSRKLKQKILEEKKKR